MTEIKNKRTSESERTLLVALLLSAPGPLIISYAAVTSHSATQLADFLRRTSELVATFVSWLIFHKLRKRSDTDVSYTVHLERLTNLTVAGAMSCSGIALLIVGVVRLFEYQAGSKVILGTIIAGLGLLTNVWFWQKYSRMNKAQPDPIIMAQQRLYRGKASVDICVFSALIAVAIAPAHPATQYIDVFGSIAVAAYLLHNGIDMFLKLKQKRF